MAEKREREPDNILRPDWLVNPADERNSGRGRSGGEQSRSGGNPGRPGPVQAGDDDISKRGSHAGGSRAEGGNGTAGRTGAGHAGSVRKSGDRKLRNTEGRRKSGRFWERGSFESTGQTRRKRSQSQGGMKSRGFSERFAGACKAILSAILPVLMRLPSVLKYAVLSAKDRIIRVYRYLYSRLSGHEIRSADLGSRQGERGGQTGAEGGNVRPGHGSANRSSHISDGVSSGFTSADVSAYTREKKAEEEAQIRTRKLLERSRDRREQQLRRHYVFLGIIILLLILCVRGIVYRVNTTRREQRMEQELDAERGGLSEAVLGYEETVKSYAKANGLTEYVDILLAIMEVESKGLGNDVMQSSESMGLPAGSLEPDESISQACAYWGRLLKIADSSGCDIRSVIQAYNFGPGYLTYVSENNGGKYSEETAIEFARQQSGGETVTYTNRIALQKNGGWMYSYGNMFYEELVEQYLPDGWDAEYK